MRRAMSQSPHLLTVLVSNFDQDLDVSTIVVMGGSGDYLDVADTVIQMHDYQAIRCDRKSDSKLLRSTLLNVKMNVSQPLEYIPTSLLLTVHL